MTNTRLEYLALLACSALLASCDKVSELAGELKDGGKQLIDANELTDANGLAVSEDEIAKSDAAAAKYLEAMEKVPEILAKVRDEETAIAARKSLDALSSEVSEIVKGLIPIDEQDQQKMLDVKMQPQSAKKPKQKASKQSGVVQKRSTPMIQGEVHWYVLEENKEKYKTRTQKIGDRVYFQLKRIAMTTRESAIAFDLVLDGVLIFASVESGGRVPSEESSKGIKPMPKEWLPPGVTRE